MCTPHAQATSQTIYESMNPEILHLGGTWRLVYTSNSELLVLLAADNLPGWAMGLGFRR